MMLKRRLGFVPLFFLLSSAPAFARNGLNEIVIQGIVPNMWEVDVYDTNADCDFESDSLRENLTVQIGTFHVYSNDPSSVGGHLFIESENSGRLINNSVKSNRAKHQKYEINLETNALGYNEIKVNDKISTLTINSSKGHDLIVPATIGFESLPGTRNIMAGTYDVLVSIPKTKKSSSSFVCTDTITFTIIDDN